MSDRVLNIREAAVFAGGIDWSMRWINSIHLELEGNMLSKDISGNFDSELSSYYVLSSLRKLVGGQSKY